MDRQQRDLQVRNPDDRDLVSMAMSDDTSERKVAFELIFLRYGDAILRVCGSMLDGERAVDAAQECLVRAMRKLWDRDPPANPDKLEGWLVLIAKNVAREQCRPGRQVPVPEIDAAHDDPAEHARTEAARLADEERRRGRRAEVLRMLDVVAATLTPAQHHVYCLSVREELVGQQLAARLGTSPAQASRQANEVRKLVRDGFGSYVLALWALHVRRTEHAEVCEGLGRVLRRQGWDGQDFTTRLRQDIHQHVEACGSCRDERDRRVRPYAPALFPLLFLPLLADRAKEAIRLVSARTPLTTAVTGKILRRARGRRPPAGSASSASRRRRQATVRAAASVTMAALIAAFLLFGDKLPGTTPLAEDRPDAATSRSDNPRPGDSAPPPSGPQGGPTASASPSGTTTASPEVARPRGPATTRRPSARPAPDNPFEPDDSFPDTGPDDTDESPESPDVIMVTVPDVIGDDYDQAVEKIEDAHLVPLRVDESSATLPGMVLGQSPDEYTEAPEGSTVTIYVATDE